MQFYIEIGLFRGIINDILGASQTKNQRNAKL